MSDVWAPPTAPLEGANPSDLAHAIDTRERHIAHETSIKSIGTLYYFVASLMILGTVLAVVAGGLYSVRALITGVVFIALAALLIWLGRAVKQLKPWTKVPVGILSAIGLLGFPAWTLINVYILYLLFSQKGAVVFSDDYKRVIAETPEIKSRTSIIVWVFVILVVAAMAVAIITRILGH